MVMSGIVLYDDLTTWTGTTESTGWKQPGNVGDTGGPDPSKTPGIFTFTPGEIGVFSAKAAYPYNNGFWYIKWRGPQTATKFLYDFWIQFSSDDDIKASQAVEFHIEQSVSNLTYNMAWQVHPSAATPWRYFDKVDRKWVASTLLNDPAIWTDGKWVKLAAIGTRNQNQTMTHESLSINGKVTDIRVEQPAKKETASDYLSCAFQLDSNKAMTPYKVAMQRCRLTAF